MRRRLTGLAARLMRGRCLDRRLRSTVPGRSRGRAERSRQGATSPRLSLELRSSVAGTSCLRRARVSELVRRVQRCRRRRQQRVRASGSTASCEQVRGRMRRGNAGEAFFSLTRSSRALLPTSTGSTLASRRAVQARTAALVDPLLDRVTFSTRLEQSVAKLHNLRAQVQPASVINKRCKTSESERGWRKRKDQARCWA